MSHPKYKFTYFDVRALGEPIRMMFVYTGTPYVDDRIPWDLPKWIKDTRHQFESSIGQLPVLYLNEENKELCNSQAISRYLANEFGLIGENNWENARIDEIIATIHDIFILWRTATFGKNAERIAFMKSKYVAPKIKLCYEKWSKILEEKEGPFILGKKVTHADFWLANFISIWDNPMTGDGPVFPHDWIPISDEDIFIGLTKDYPALRKHLEAVENIPEIKEWIVKRHDTII